MIPGGIADKLGNRFEAKWLVCQMISLLKGDIDSVEYESIDPAFNGFEFRLGTGSTSSWHQTKRSAPGGNWTMGALSREGVFKAFAERLAASPTDTCHFVSQDNAAEFRILSEKARLASEAHQFKDALSKEQSRSLDLLNQHWATDLGQTFQWLRRCHVSVIPEHVIDWLIDSLCDFYFVHGSHAAFATLREIAESNFNRRIDRETLIDAIVATGTLRVKDWSLDSTLKDRVAACTTDYLATFASFGFGGVFLERQSTDELRNALNDKNVELILLTGTAGSGKSGIVRQLISELVQSGTPHLALRIDQCLECSTRAQLGQLLLQRDEGPVTTLRGLFPDCQSVLILDQVDAISEVSGRDGKIRNVIFQLISDAAHLGQVKIVVVCRTFDLESDERLKQLKELNRTREVNVPSLRWKEDVNPILDAKGINSSEFSEPQKRLLELAINLAVFLEIGDGTLLADSRSALHQRLIEKKDRQLRRDLRPSWTIGQVLGVICSRMHQRQELSAPLAVLDPYPGAADFLRSEGLIATSRDRLNFFHESFFDHVFARSFASDPQSSLISMLMESEQHLFRRTQVRQILEALRQMDRIRYLEELATILGGNKVRFHVKLAVAQWLSTVDDPTEEEFGILWARDDNGDRYDILFGRSVLVGSRWFELLNAKGWIAAELAKSIEFKTNHLLWWLSYVAADQPTEVAALLRIWWGGQLAQASQLIGWFGYVQNRGKSEQLLLLCCDIIECHPEALFKSRDADRLSMMLHTWGDEAPEKCGRLLEAIFSAWMSAHPDSIPFERDVEKVLDSHWLMELRKKAPLALVVGATDAIRIVVDRVVADGPGGSNWYQIAYRTHHGSRFGFDEFLHAYVESLKQIAGTDASAASSIVDRLDPFKHETLMHIHLETIQGNPAAFSDRLQALLNSPLAFDAGWNGADWLSAANACRACLPHLDSGAREQVEEVVLARRPEIEFAIRMVRNDGTTPRKRPNDYLIHILNRSGHEEWCILETIEEGLLSNKAMKRLQELRRKFREHTPSEPTAVEVHMVGSPIKRRACEHMTDDHWLSAIEKYASDDDRHYGKGFIDGGARQLAGELGTEAKTDPARFTALLDRIPASSHPTYVENIVRGVTDAAEPGEAVLSQAFRYAHEMDGHPYGSELAHMVAKHPQLGRQSYVLDAIIWYALEGQANEDEKADQEVLKQKTVTIEHLIERSGGLRILGMSGARGWAWEALERVLWDSSDCSEPIWKAIETAAKTERLIGVRCSLIHPLTPLFNLDKARFAKTLKSLLGMEHGSLAAQRPERLAPLATHAGLRLLPYVIHAMPELGRELIKEMLDSSSETHQLIGAWLLFGQSFRDPDYVAEATVLGASGIDHRRLLADVAAQAIVWTDDVERAEELLIKFFHDSDTEVRNQASDVFRNIAADDLGRYSNLIKAYLASPAYGDGAFALLHLLDKSPCDISEFVVEAARRAIEDVSARGNDNGRRSSDFHSLQDLIKREYVSSERNPSHRRELLDLIDLMLINDVGGTDEVVKAHDRW